MINSQLYIMNAKVRQSTSTRYDSPHYAPHQIDM